MKLLFGRLFMPAAAGCQTVEKRAHAHDRHGGVGRELYRYLLASRLRNCHYFQQVAVRVLEVEATPAPAGIDLPVGVVAWPAAVGETLGLHPTKDRLEIRVADMEGVVMPLAPPWVGTRPAPRFLLVGEVKGQALVDLYLRETALACLDRQSEDFGKELS